MKKLFYIALLFIVVPAFASSGHGSGLSEGYWFRQLAGLVNLSILIGVLVYLLKKPIAEAFVRKQKEVADAIENAKRKEEEAERKVKEVEERLASLKSEIEQILNKTDEAANMEKEKIIKKAHEEAEKIKKMAELSIENRMKTAKREIKEYIATLAVKTAEEKIINSLSEKDIEKSYEKYLEELEV